MDHIAMVTGQSETQYDVFWSDIDPQAKEGLYIVESHGVESRLINGGASCRPGPASTLTLSWR